MWLCLRTFFGFCNENFKVKVNRNICPFRFSGLSPFRDRFSYFLVVSHCPRAKCKCKCEYCISVCGSNSYIRCACALRSSSLHCWKCCPLSRRLWLLLCLIRIVPPKSIMQSFLESLLRSHGKINKHSGVMATNR